MYKRAQGFDVDLAFPPSTYVVVFMLLFFLHLNEMRGHDCIDSGGVRYDSIDMMHRYDVSK